jgi:flagellum-specific ATP synthase
VTSPADTSPLARARGAEYAAEVAAYFRDAGLNVVMIVDSLTRYAIACREISMSMGEPPVSRGYPPSVFAKLTSLVEQAGNGESEQGSLTAFYTVLLDSDDAVDPVADAARGVLDGHLFLSRSLANSGHFPAIDVERHAASRTERSFTAGCIDAKLDQQVLAVARHGHDGRIYTRHG